MARPIALPSMHAQLSQQQDIGQKLCLQGTRVLAVKVTVYDRHAAAQSQLRQSDLGRTASIPRDSGSEVETGRFRHPAGDPAIGKQRDFLIIIDSSRRSAGFRQGRPGPSTGQARRSFVTACLPGGWR